MSHKIKVLHVVGKMHPGGIETLLMNVFRHLDRDRYEFHFAVQSEERAFYDDEIEALGGRILRQPHPQRGLKRFRRAFEANVRKHGPYGAVHSHIFGFSGYVLKLASGLGIPVRISHSHTVHRKTRESLLRRLYRQHMQRLILKHTTHMLGCSRAACESLFGTNCWSDSRVQVFPNAIALLPYESLPSNRASLRERLGIPNDGTQVFAHIGRFQPLKNHSFLIDRFAEYLRTNPDAKLLLVGDGPEKQAMQEKVERLGLSGHIEFLGLRRDIPELLGAADGFILPSQYEGLGIVLIEAQAAGVPCLISEGVPDEADLKLGLVSRLRLDDAAGKWVEGFRQLALTPQPEWPKRLVALESSGFNMSSSVRRLERLYGG
ncbi:Putative glycosyltransferase EpsF [Paenibacillus plantiphilus]|uniref:Glycosyltransferase EpsF n=1 Tax=Paenibacillus plantiphilus TaxID=2905650 RepID=A0ABM9CBA5_9BACL|nr:glycosyltransferase [Paenibacillus plantiphilus]CAH1206838.1 Putative glycosyltransferase EpsF [Paenibacillus plantiphilus]